MLAAVALAVAFIIGLYWSVFSLVGLWTVILLLAVMMVRETLRRSAAENDAAENLRRYHRLADHSIDMIVTFDPHTQQRTYVSPSCRRLYGYEPEEALRVSAREIIHPDDLATVQAAVRRAEHGDQTPVTYRGRRKDGTYIWVEASLTPLKDPTTGKVQIVSVVRDITERVRYQTELMEAKERADAANKSKSEFLAVISHELRTPLNAIIGFSDLMVKEVIGPIGNERYRGYIADIHHSGNHLLDLINDILDLSKAEAGKLDLYEEIVDVSEIVRSVIRVLSARVEAAGLSSRINVPTELPMLRADERKLRQIIFNLIGNALKFTPAGGYVEVRASAGSVNGCAITVADSGIGISPENQTRVFQPFVQVSGAFDRTHQGTGLGLPLVKAMVELHQGQVTLKSTVGIGTEVTITFPPERVIERRPFLSSEVAA